MATPWEIGNQFLQMMAQGTQRDSAAAQNMMQTMAQSQLGRQDMQTRHGLGLEELGIRNQYNVDAATVAHDRTVAREQQANTWQQERDITGAGLRLNELDYRHNIDMDTAEYQNAIKLREEAIAAQKAAGITGAIGQEQQVAAIPPVPRAPRRYAPNPMLVNSESGGNFRAQNNEVGSGGQRGHYGRIQFGHARLQEAKDAGVIPQNMTPQQFMNDEAAQRRTEQWHFADINRFIEQNGLDRYEGTNIGGAQVTRTGMENVAHLGGKSGLRRYLQSGGRYNAKDANGTTLQKYMAMGAGQQSSGAAVRGDNSSVGEMSMDEWHTFMETTRMQPVTVAEVGPQTQALIGADDEGRLLRTPLARMELSHQAVNQLKDRMRGAWEDYFPDLDMNSRTGTDKYYIYAPRPRAQDEEKTGSGVSDNRESRKFGTGGSRPSNAVSAPNVEMQTGAGRALVRTPDGRSVTLEPETRQ